MVPRTGQSWGLGLQRVPRPWRKREELLQDAPGGSWAQRGVTRLEVGSPGSECLPLRNPPATERTHLGDLWDRGKGDKPAHRPCWPPDGQAG